MLLWKPTNNQWGKESLALLYLGWICKICDATCQPQNEKFGKMNARSQITDNFANLKKNYKIDRSVFWGGREKGGQPMAIENVASCLDFNCWKKRQNGITVAKINHATLAFRWYPIFFQKQSWLELAWPTGWHSEVWCGHPLRPRGEGEEVRRGAGGRRRQLGQPSISCGKQKWEGEGKDTFNHGGEMMFNLAGMAHIVPEATPIIVLFLLNHLSSMVGSNTWYFFLDKKLGFLTQLRFLLPCDIRPCCQTNKT